MSTDSVLDDLRLDIRLTDAPHDRTSYVPPWATTMSMSPRQLLGSTTTMAPSFGPLGTPARLTSGASLARSPPVWADDTPSYALSLGAEPITRRDLHSALVHASCRSTTWGELAPPSLGRHPFHVGVTATEASAAVPTAGDDPRDDQHDHELTPAELAGFVAELVDARATIDFLKGRVSTLTSLLDRSANTAYECYDCADLRITLHSAEQSLASSAEPPPNAQMRGAVLSQPCRILTMSTPRPLRDQSVLS